VKKKRPIFTSKLNLLLPFASSIINRQSI